MGKDVYNNSEQFKDYSNLILKNLKSQLLKTNGFGAIMMLFPAIYKTVNKAEYDQYYIIINKLREKINWSNDEILI